MAIDFLFFGAHPDDVEWGLGATLLLLQQQRSSFAIVDLTRGEMGSRGTDGERRQEARDAAQAVGAAARETLELPDCGLIDSPENRRMVAGVIRRYRPKAVLAPYWKDRHPDHAAAGWLVRNSRLYATLRKLDDPNPPHKPEIFLYYPLHEFLRPSIVIDTSALFTKKMELLRLHISQFSSTAEDLGLLPLGLGDYLFGLESRDRMFGSMIGVRYGEALITDQPLKLASLAEVLR